MTTAERINYIVDHLCDGNANEFCRKTGIAKSTVSRLRSGALGKNGIGSFAEKIAVGFRQVNCRWLLTGDGEPFAKEAAEGEIKAELRALRDAVEELAKRRG